MNSMLAKLSNFWKHITRQQDADGIDTLTAFVRDAEFDILSAITALQAHVDILHDEQERHNLPVSGFIVLNRAIARITTDMVSLADISELVVTPRSRQIQSLSTLMKEIAQETQPEFILKKANLSCNIVAGTTLVGSAAALKIMITGAVMAALGECPESETIWVTAREKNDRLCLSINSGVEADESLFAPWRLGELRLAPANGLGINLAAVDALARLHQGHLSMSTLSNLRHGYRLIFQVP